MDDYEDFYPKSLEQQLLVLNDKTCFQSKVERGYNEGCNGNSSRSSRDKKAS